MPPARRLSSLLFGIGKKESKNDDVVDVDILKNVSLKLDCDKKVYRPGDSVTITIQIRIHPESESESLLIEKLSFEAKGIEKLDTQWFTTHKPLPPDSNHNHIPKRRGEYVFMESIVSSLVSNQIISPGTTTTYILRIHLPTIIPPSYRGSTVRYLYHVKTEMSAKYMNMDDRHPSTLIEARLPLQIWVTEKTNGLLNEETGINGIVPYTPILLDVYWKDMDAESEWARANETFDGVDEGYESQRDDMSSVSSYNPAKGSLQKAFGSSLSLQSSTAISSKDVPYHDQKSTISSYMALPQLSAAVVLYGSTEDNVSPRRSSVIVSPNQQPSSPRSLSMDDGLRPPAVTRTVESVA